MFALAPAERAATALDRLHGTTVPTGRVLGTNHRGWQRGRETAIVRDVGGYRSVVVDLDPGVPPGGAAEVPEQRLGTVRIHGPDDRRDGQDALPCGALDDITASELLRDLEHLRG